jgi:hypothetical protein
MPPANTFANSGAQQLMCSVCYSGTATTLSGEGSVAQVLGQLQGVPCENVIACTGPVSPLGNVPTPGGGVCATMQCNGIWVNGCTPPVAITPSVPGVCFTTGQPPSFPLPDRVTVGCFPGDQPSDVWQRCRQRYSSFVTDPGIFSDTTCADEWKNPDPSSQGFQECQALVRACIQATFNACGAAAAAELRDLERRINGTLRWTDAKTANEPISGKDVTAPDSDARR